MTVLILISRDFMFWLLFMAFFMKCSLRHWKMCLKQIISKVKAESDKQLAVYQNHLKSYISQTLKSDSLRNSAWSFSNVSEPITKCDYPIFDRFSLNIVFLNSQIYLNLKVIKMSFLAEPLMLMGTAKTTVTMIDH